MGAIKGYNLRTRDMYHPLYSTYQLDYVRPNVWEIVIAGNSPGQFMANGQYGSRQISAGAGENTRNATTTDYTSEGHDTLKSFNASASGGLSLYCKKFELNLPKSHVIQAQWISGVTKLAGRNSEGFSINAEFYAGLGANSLKNLAAGDTHLGSLAVTDDILRLLYAWRNLCFDARTGQIGLAPSYKKPATLFMYDPSGTKILYEFTVHGLWPSSIGNISLDVASDDIITLSVTFEADFIYMEDETSTMDSTFTELYNSEAGHDTAKKMLYNNDNIDSIVYAANSVTGSVSQGNTSSGNTDSYIRNAIQWIQSDGSKKETYVSQNG